MNNPSLLEIIPLPKKGKIQAFTVVPVSPETAPYLVTSSKSVVWVKSPKEGNVVWAAIRNRCAPTFLYEEMFRSILDKSMEEGWENVFSQSQVDKACMRLCEYDIVETELLVGPDFPVEDLKIPAFPVEWLPAGYAVVVPSNRAFLGSLMDFANGEFAAVVHNASRGISILVP